MTYPHLGHACDHCGRIYYTAAVTGRPRRYCSSACRQAAYRRATDDARGRRITELAALRNAASGPGGGDRRFDVTKPTETPQSDANAPTHTNTHADAETVPCASPGAAVREVRPVPEVTPCE